MKKRILYIVSLIMALNATTVVAQNVILNAKLDTFAIRIGEQTKATLDLSVDSGSEVVMPPLKEQVLVDGIEILEGKEYKESIDEGRRDRYVQEYLITSFDSTRYNIAPFNVVVNSDTFKSNRMVLDVYSVEIDTANIYNIAGPGNVIEVELTWEEIRDSVYLATILFFVGALFAWVVIRLINNKPIIRIIKIKPKLPSHIVAISKIDEIKGDTSLHVEGNEKAYYTQLTDVLREYLERRFGFNAMEMTTSEIVDELLKIKDKESIKELKEILEVADLVKFAKMHPTMYENDRNMLNAVEFVNATKNIEEENIKQPTEQRIVSERSLKQKRVLLASVIILAVIIIGVAVLLTTDLYNMFS